MRPIFNVDGTTISISRGDTGAVRFRANVTIRGTEETYTFSERDRAVFTIKNGAGEIVKEKIAKLTDNVFTVIFFNQDTDLLSAGNYNWDVRYVINPYWENAVEDEHGDIVSGRIVDGDQVLTPNAPMSMQLLTVVGEI